MKNLFYRILTAIILLPVVIYAFIAGGISLLFLISFASLLCTFEIAQIVMSKNKIAVILSLLAWIFIQIPLLISSNPVSIGAYLIVLFFLFNLFFLFSSKSPQFYEQLALVFYFSSYVFLAVTSLFWLRSHHNLPEGVGISFIILACISTWANDIFAYFGGRMFGKKPLFLSVSAKKTWEGFFSGAIGSVLTVLILAKITILFGFELFIGLAHIDIWCIAIPSIFLAPLGDLVESRLKRLYGAKDSSNILPGHGGLLDRIDGLLLVLPWTYIYAFFIHPLW